MNINFINSVPAVKVEPHEAGDMFKDFLFAAKEDRQEAGKKGEMDELTLSEAMKRQLAQMVDDMRPDSMAIVDEAEEEISLESAPKAGGGVAAAVQEQKEGIIAIKNNLSQIEYRVYKALEEGDNLTASDRKLIQGEIEEYKVIIDDIADRVTKTVFGKYIMGTVALGITEVNVNSKEATAEAAEILKEARRRADALEALFDGAEDDLAESRYHRFRALVEGHIAEFEAQQAIKDRLNDLLNSGDDLLDAGMTLDEIVSRSMEADNTSERYGETAASVVDNILARNRELAEGENE